MKKNLNKLYEIMVFTGLIAGMAYLLASGKVGFYLHPKMIKYVFFALVMLVLIDLYWILAFMKESGTSKSFRYSSLILALPILFMAVFPSRISGSVLHNKVVKMGDGNITVNLSSKSSGDDNVLASLGEISEEAETGEEMDLKALEEAAMAPIDDSVVSLGDMDASDLEAISEDSMGPSGGEMSAEEVAAEEVSASQPTDETAEAVTAAPIGVSVQSVIVMDDFWELLVAVYQNQDQMLGQTMQVEGFIFREEGFKSNTAIISRLVMSCCAADAYITGVFLKDEAVVSELADDGWYRITGVLAEEAVYNPISDSYQMELVLTGIKAEAIEAYENPYIYPQ